MEYTTNKGIRKRKGGNQIMAFIKIKKLIASGPNVEPSSIVFGNKLTIIAGPSDTGKTCIFKCIDYIFGGNNDANNLPFDELDKYNEISLLMETHKGSITLSRIQKENITNVISNIDGIESGEYVLKENKSNQKTINKLFLQLIDAPTDLKLPKNDKGSVGSFTWRTIKNSFIINEERADTKKSILIDTDGQPLYLASMIYLLSGNELTEYKGDKDSELIKKTKKNTLIDFIKLQRETLEKKKKAFEEKLSSIPEGKSLDELISGLNNQIDEINEKLDKASSDYSKLSSQRIVVNERLIKNKSLIERYDTLSSQYNTDINRLTFIVDNEDLLKKHSKKTRCPYCDSEMKLQDQSSYIKASQAELVKAIKNSSDLEETRVNIQNRIVDDEDLLDDIDEQITEINKLINNSYIPQRTFLIKELQSYKEYIQIQASLELVHESDNEFASEMSKIESEKISSFTPFKGKPLFYNLIAADLTNECRSILEEIGYPVQSVALNKSSIDLVINGKAKANRGKGYKAFTNSVLLLGFRKYLYDHSPKCYNFYMFDSPLKGLSIPDEDVASNIRTGFFNYLVNNQLNDQVIIIENTQDAELPNITETDDIKIYKFTQDEKNGRYGFLESVRKN